jgi:tetratricopeptide (TPR) repeat protein
MPRPARPRGRAAFAPGTAAALRRALCAAAWCAQLLLPAGAAAHQVGAVVPFFRGADVKGAPVSLGELVAQKRVVVFFWDYRRATSTREMNVLDGLYRSYARQGLEVLAVEGEGVGADQVVERIDKLRLIGTAPTYPVLPDPGGRIARQFGVDVTPQTFFIDRAGRIAFHLEDFRTGDEQLLETNLKVFLGIAPPPAAAPAPRPATADPADPAPPPEPEPKKEAENPRTGLLEKYRYFGNFYANKKEPAKAEEYYRKYLELEPEDAAVWLLLGEVYALQGSYDRAREAWENVLRIQPGNAEADANIRRLIRGEY